MTVTHHGGQMTSRSMCPNLSAKILQGVCWVFFPLLTPEIFETSRCCVKRDRHDSRLRKATTASQAAWFLKIWGNFKDFTHPHFFGRSILGIARAYWFWMALAFCKFGRPPKPQRLNMNATSRLKVMEVSCVWDMPLCLTNAIRKTSPWTNWSGGFHTQIRFPSHIASQDFGARRGKTQRLHSHFFNQLDLWRWSWSRETLAYNTPCFAVNHGTMVCPMPPATGWNARPHPPHRVRLSGMKSVWCLFEGLKFVTDHVWKWGNGDHNLRPTIFVWENRLSWGPKFYPSMDWLKRKCYRKHMETWCLPPNIHTVP